MILGASNNERFSLAFSATEEAVHRGAEVGASMTVAGNCEVCGGYFKQLIRHLRKWHGIVVRNRLGIQDRRKWKALARSWDMKRRGVVEG